MILKNVVLKGKPQNPREFKEFVLVMLYEFNTMEKGNPMFGFLKQNDLSAEVMIKEIEDETKFGNELIGILKNMLEDEIMFRRQDYAGISKPDLQKVEDVLDQNDGLNLN